MDTGYLFRIGLLVAAEREGSSLFSIASFLAKSSSDSCREGFASRGWGKDGSPASSPLVSSSGGGLGNECKEGGDADMPSL